MCHGPDNPVFEVFLSSRFTSSRMGGGADRPKISTTCSRFGGMEVFTVAKHAVRALW
jgi:hypothetical protein